MSLSDHSSLSDNKSTHLLNYTSNRGLHKVKYQGDTEFDYSLHGGQKPIDVSLVLPHYRAHNQPINHKMSLTISGEDEPIKVKICRSIPQTNFELEVLADTSDVTVWLPSDFKGQIRYSGRPTFSAGFINRILQNSRLNEADQNDYQGEDYVVVVSQGHITFRMWDVQTRSPENTRKECFKRLFGCSSKASETSIDWDTLLRD